MKNKISNLLILVLGCLIFIHECNAQTTALTFGTISNDYLRPGNGANNWNDGYVVPVPPGGSTGVAAGIDRYVRLAWSQLQKDDGTFDFSAFDVRAHIAIDNHQKYSIGWFGFAEGVQANSSPGGTPCTYPGFLHTQMQGEAQPDWNGGDTWVANGNSPSYLTAWKNLCAAIANHIATTTYNGVPYSKVIYMVDVRPFGNFGECHFYPFDNAGTSPNGQAMPSYIKPTQAACDSIISWYIKYFPNNPLTILHLFYGGINSYTPVESIYYSLTAQNNWGLIGWRRDSWGDASNYSYVLENNSGSYLGFSFKTAIMSRYQTAPVNGEPLNGLGSYHDLIAEATKYGLSSFGNGNIANPTTPSVVSDIQAASFASGCRLQLKSSGGTITTTIPVNSTFQLTLPWSNLGASPAYETWIANLIIKNSGGTVVKTQASNFKPKLFLPGSANFIDNISTTGLPAGNYTLYVKIVDSIGYRKPMMISNTGLQVDTSYQITPFTISAGGGGGTPPTVSAGADITITSPTASASPTATVTFHSPATAATPHWIQISGPNTATISNANVLNPTMSGLTQGNYVFQVTGTDNTTPTPLTASDQMQIIVNPANQAPNASAANVTITLPVTSIAPSITGSPKTPATTVGFNYVFLSSATGVTPTVTNGNTSTPIVSGLITAGTYIFTLTVTDNNSPTPLFTVVHDTITVNAAPTGCALCIVSSGGLDKLWTLSPAAVYCWGNRRPVIDTVPKLPKCKPPTVTVPNYTVQLPTNSVKISIQAKGNNASGIKSYLTKQRSGITALVKDSTTTTPTISNLVAGTVYLTITVKDSCGAITNYTDTVTVKPVVVPPPATKYLVKVVHVPAENQYDLYYSDGSVTFLNILKTYLWMYETSNSANAKGIIFNITLSDGKTNTIYK